MHSGSGVQQKRVVIEILDSTLREGEQTRGVSFSIEDKLEIARLIDDFGVDFIELGHPSVSRDVRQAVERLAAEPLRAKKLVHARATHSDIDDAVSTGAEWIGIFLGTSPLSLQHKFHVTQERALSMISDAVRHAKDRGLKVRFTPEDATRTPVPYLIEAIECAQEAGADRISIADTVGVMLPTQIKGLIEQIAPFVKVPLHLHCHNDYGLAVANALAGYEAGVRLIDVAVNGLGERAGITSLAELVVALKMHYGVSNDWNLALLPDLSRLVERCSGIFNSETRPIVGANAFSHKAGLHSRAVLEDPRTYEAIPPEIVKREREIVIDKYTGKAAVRARFNDMNVTMTEDQLTQIVEIIKSRPQKRYFSDIDLIEIADDVLKLNLRGRVPIEVEAIIQLALTSSLYTTHVTRKLIARNEVREVYEITGDFDVVARVTTHSLHELNETIEEIRVMEGINRTQTSIILKNYAKN